jgi:hypothetical protein
MSKRGQLVKGVATSIRENAERYTVVRYHQTDVVVFNPFEIILDSGGWRTATTKKRMNQAAQEFRLGFSVFQRSGKWIVEFNGIESEFMDGMRLIRKERPAV